MSHRKSFKTQGSKLNTGWTFPVPLMEVMLSFMEHKVKKSQFLLIVAITRALFEGPIGRKIRTTVRIRWNFAQMCCAMSLVCPSIATHSTYQFSVRSEPVNMLKTIATPAKCGVRTVIRFLYFRTSYEECCPQVLPFFMTILDRTLQLQQRGSWSVFDGKCLIITNHHPPGLGLPVIFISFLVWNGRWRTTFWHNELQTSVENWLKAQAAGFYDESIVKLASRYEKCLRRSVDFVEKYTLIQRMIIVQEHRYPHTVAKTYSSPSLSFPKPAQFSLHFIAQSWKKTFVYLSNHHLYTEMQLKRRNSKIYSLFVIVRSF